MAQAPAAPSAPSDLDALAKRSSEQPAAGSQPDKSCGCPKRKVNGVELKYLKFQNMSHVGHSWYEMQGGQSVGWWPSPQSWRIGSFVNTNGAVNNGRPRDPHHGDAADTTYDLYTRDGDCRTDEEIQRCIRNFYYGKQASGARYSVMSWDVCHSVANEASSHCKLTQQAR